ncbi:MAG: hypothetical protein WC242_00560 [Candidatus Paceibacterota bacterium]|jgi:hypothetical protein
MIISTKEAEIQNVVVLDGHSTFKVVGPFICYDDAKKYLEKEGYQEQEPGNFRRTIPGDVDNIVGNIRPLVNPS